MRLSLTVFHLYFVCINCYTNTLRTPVSTQVDQVEDNFVLVVRLKMKCFVLKRGAGNNSKNKSFETVWEDIVPGLISRSLILATYVMNFRRRWILFVSIHSDLNSGWIFEPWTWFLIFTYRYQQTLKKCIPVLNYYSQSSWTA